MGEVFEMLMTFSDFMAFKEMVLDYRGVSWGEKKLNCVCLELYEMFDYSANYER